MFWNFSFDDVFVAEKGACPCGPPIRVGKVKEWGKVHEMIASNFFFLPVSGESEERRGEGCTNSLTHQ